MSRNRLRTLGEWSCLGNFEYWRWRRPKSFHQWFLWWSRFPRHSLFLHSLFSLHVHESRVCWGRLHFWCDNIVFACLLQCLGLEICFLWLVRVQNYASDSKFCSYLQAGTCPVPMTAPSRYSSCDCTACVVFSCLFESGSPRIVVDAQNMISCCESSKHTTPASRFPPSN